MKTMKRIAKWACALGMVYGTWLGGRAYSSDADVLSSMVIIALSVVIILQVQLYDKAKA